MVVGEVAPPLVAMDYRVSSYRAIIASTTAILNSDHSHQNGLQDLLDEELELQALDHRLFLACELLRTETQYLKLVQSVLDIYAEPFRKLTSLPQEDHRILFVGLEPIVSLSAMIASKLDDATQNWDPSSTKVGNLFSSKFWSHYDDYADGFCAIEGLLAEKYENDESFVEFLELRQGKSELTLEDLLRLPVQRIPEYDKYLNELLQETDPGHPDYDHLSRAAAKVRHMVKEREDELGNMDHQKRMERVQDKFPYDDLQLRDLDHQRRQLASRRKSAPGAVLFKTLGKSKSANNLLTQSMGKKDMEFLRPIRQHNNFNRQYLMEGNVEFSRGVQTQDRYLFLFSDLLLVAKQKSNTTFKLKHRIRVSEVWITFCIDEVTELTRPPERSFVIGWPTTNVVATFKSEELKETWLYKLKEQIEDERGKLMPKQFNLEVHYKETNKECQIEVEPTTEVNTIVKSCIEQLELPDKDLKDYQLWVRLGPDESPYPLCGHELPYGIKLSHLRDFAKRTEDNLTEIEIQRIMTEMQTNNRKYEFFLKHKKSQKRQSLEETSSKPTKGKKGKSPLINLFRGKNRDDKKPQGQLFGHPLASVTSPDNLIAKPVRELLTIMFREAPYTVGILRKSCNAKALKELRQRLDDGEACLSDENLQPLVIGSLVKDYLRSIPHSLLMEELFTDWLAANDVMDPTEKINKFRDTISKMPACHEELLRHVMCVLYHIDKKSDINKMTAYNLSVCITPSMLWPKGSNPDPLATPPAIVQFMIEHCSQVFGETVIHLFGDPLEQKLRQDSSTDSDSMHSVLSNHSNFRRDDSSIDSLEREIIYNGEMDSSPHITKSHHFSPSNLSGDSGLTLSDSQLYDEDGNGNEIAPDRRYGRSASHCLDADNQADDNGQASRSLDSNYFYDYDPQNPVPPPRRLKKKGSEQNQSPNMEYDRKPLRFTSQANFQMSGRNDRRFQQSVHNNDKYKRSLESLKSVEEGSEGESVGYMKGYPRNKDYGTLVKSASGAHLFYDDFTSQFEFSDDFDNSSRSSRNGRLFKQASDGAMPMSPQSKYSLSSSRDSVLSDSSGSFFNRQNSPDRLSSSAETPDMEERSMSQWLAQQSQETQFMNLSQRQFSHDDSEVGLKMDKKNSNKMEYLVSPKTSPKLKRREPLPLSGRRSFPLQSDQSPRGSGSNSSKEAEDIIRSPKLTITYCSQDSLDKRSFDTPSKTQSPQLDLYNNNSQLALKQLNIYSTGLQGTSPPPRVVLQGLGQNGAREKRENTPLKGNHNILSQERRKSVDLGEIRERPRYPMEENSVSSEDGSDSESEVETYRVMTMVTVPLKYNVSQKVTEPQNEADSAARPVQPPAYNEAVQRNFMIKQGLSPDSGVDEAAVQRQREANLKALQLYEQSMKQYQEQRERSAFSLPSQQFEQKLDVVGEKLEEHVTSDVEHGVEEEEVEDEEQSSEEEAPDHNPRKLYEESLRRYMEEQSSQVKPPLVKAASQDEEFSISRPRGGDLKQNLKKLANIYRSQSDAQDFSYGRVGRGSLTGAGSHGITETTPTKRPVQPPPYNNPPPYHSERSDSSPSRVDRHRFPVARETFYSNTSEKSVSSSMDVPKTVSQQRSSLNAQVQLGSKSKDNVVSRKHGSTLPLNKDTIYHEDVQSKNVVIIDQSVRSAQNEMLNVNSPVQKVHNSMTNRDHVFRPRASSLEQRSRATAPASSAQGPIVNRNPNVSKSQVIRSSDQTARRNSLDTSGSKSATRELPWSVKSLSNIFDQNKTTEVQSKPLEQSQRPGAVSPASSSPSRPSVPPPYTPPPQHADHMRSSMSSTSSRSSVGTSRSIGSSRRSFSKLGPQARDSFSSTDDSDCSCRYSLNCRRDNSSFEDLDNLSFTDITYV